MLEERNWQAELREEENAAAYIQRTLGLSDREIKQILKYHLAGVNGKLVKEGSPVRSGDLLSVSLPDERPEKYQAEAADLDILYDNSPDFGTNSGSKLN